MKKYGIRWLPGQGAPHLGKVNAMQENQYLDGILEDNSFNEAMAMVLVFAQIPRSQLQQQVNNQQPTTLVDQGLRISRTFT